MTAACMDQPGPQREDAHELSRAGDRDHLLAAVGIGPNGTEMTVNDQGQQRVSTLGQDALVSAERPDLRLAGQGDERALGRLGKHGWQRRLESRGRDVAVGGR